jgi:hypothetical protein
MLCPDCTPGNRRGSMADVARAAQRARTRAAERTEERDRARAAAPLAEAGLGSPAIGSVLDGAEALDGYAARGRADAALSLWSGATADQLEQAATGRRTRYYEGVRTPEGDAENGAFANSITAALAHHAAGRQPAEARARRRQKVRPEFELEAGS